MSEMVRGPPWAALSVTLCVFPADLTPPSVSGSGHTSTWEASHHLETSPLCSRAPAQQAICPFCSPLNLSPSGSLAAHQFETLTFQGHHHWISLHFSKAHPSLQPVISRCPHPAVLTAGSTSAHTVTAMRIASFPF